MDPPGILGQSLMRHDPLPARRCSVLWHQGRAQPQNSPSRRRPIVDISRRRRVRPHTDDGTTEKGSPNMRIAITGGLGRLGQYVVRALAAHAPRVLDIGAPADPPPNYRQADLRDLAALRAGAARHRGGGAPRRDRPLLRHRRRGDHAGQRDGHLEPVRGQPPAPASAAWSIAPPARRPARRQQPRDAALLSADRRGASDATDRCLWPQQAVRRADRRRVLAPGDGGAGDPPLLRCVPRDGGLHGGQARTGGPGGADALSARLCRAGGLRARFRRRGRDRRLRRLRGLLPGRRRRVRHQPTVARMEALYGATIPVRDPALYAARPRASPVSHAAARARLGWVPTTRWTGRDLRTG